jgi:excisionase family DNA binding protein
MDALKDYLSTREAGEKYELSKEHIARMLKAGRLKGKKVGHDWLVYEPSLQKYKAQMDKLGSAKHGLRKQSSK